MKCALHCPLVMCVFCVYVQVTQRRRMSKVFFSICCFKAQLLVTVLHALCLCMCVGVTANRSVRRDAAESSCHSPMSKLAAVTFHFMSQERV